MSRNKNIMVAAVLIFLLVTAFYMYKAERGEKTNNNQQQQNNNQNNNQNQIDTTTLKDKILVLVGKSNEGKKEEALAGYLALEKDNPSDLMLLNNVAVIYSDMANWTKSEEYYKKLLVAHPEYIPGYRMLAYLYEYRFNDDEIKIKALIDDGLAKNNNNPDLLNWIISYYQEKNEGDKAIPYSNLLTQQLNKQ